MARFLAIKTPILAYLDYVSCFFGPLCADALQRERRQMQSKHLWYTIDIRWHELAKKIQVLTPTGLTREQLWHHLFVLKHRQNPFKEGKYKGVDFAEVFFFLSIAAAHDSCGQVPARLVKKKSTSAHLETTKTKPQPKTPKNNTKPTSELE